MGEILLLSLTAALNPTLLAATTLMLVLPSPKRLLLGYLCGALLTSISIGCVIVFALSDPTSSTSTSKHTLNPILDIVLGSLILIITFVVSTGRDQRRRARRERKKAAKADKPLPRWQRMMSEGTARTTFVIGALLTLPGASYLAGLSKIAHENYATAGTVLSILLFNLVMLMLLEIPLIGYTIAPEATADRIQRMRAWLARDGGRIAVIGATVVGLALLGRGIGGLVS